MATFYKKLMKNRCATVKFILRTENIFRKKDADFPDFALIKLMFNASY